MPNMLLKISADLLAAVGAKDEAEFPVKLVALLKASALQSKTISDLTAQVDALETEVLNLQESAKTSPASASGLTEAKATEIATAISRKIILENSETFRAAAAAEGSRVAAEALGATGTNPSRASAPTDHVAPHASFAAAVDSIVASGKTKAQAVREAMTSHPKLYKEYLVAGGKF